MKSEPKMPDRFKDGIYRVNLLLGTANIVVKNRAIAEVAPALRKNWSAEKAIRLMSMATYFPLPT